MNLDSYSPKSQKGFEGTVLTSLIRGVMYSHSGYTRAWVQRAERKKRKKNKVISLEENKN